MKEDNLLNILSSVQANLPTKQKKLCDYILNNCQSVYLMPVSELAENAGVGVATVMRLVERLEYPSFNAFKKELNEACMACFPVRGIQQPFSALGSKEVDSVSSCFYESIQALEETLRDIDRKQFGQIIDLLLNARTVHLLGLRTSKPLALYLSYQLEPLLNSVQLLNENDLMIFDRLLRFSPGDVLLIISNTRITKLLLDIVEYCREHSIPVIVITDGEDNPILSNSVAHICTAKNENNRYSVLPTFAVLETLISEIGIRTAPISVQTLNKRDHFLQEHEITL